MELYIKQRIFSFGDRFSVYNAAGEEVYYVEGEVFTFGKKLHLYDCGGRELAYIEQQLFTFRPHYQVFLNGREFATIIREFTFFHPEYTVEGPGWSVQGDFWDHDYAINDGVSNVASVEKEWFTLGDAYRISVADGRDAVAALAVVLVIDACIAAERN